MDRDIQELKREVARAFCDRPEIAGFGLSNGTAGGPAVRVYVFDPEDPSTKDLLEEIRARVRPFPLEVIASSRAQFG